MTTHYKALSIAFGGAKSLAVSLTLFRLGFRLKIQRFWWEDVWAAVALLCTVISIISALIASWTNDHESILIAGRIDAYMFTSIVWSVRMSLIFSIIRITPSTPLRRITFAAAAWFFLIWAITFSLQTWWCLDNTKIWSGQARPECVLSRSIAIFEATTNCVADAMTVLFSLKLLWRVKLPRRQRRMIVSLFLTSRFLCMFSLAHSIAQLVGDQSVEEILANLQLTVFLVVCNLLVVVTYVYRVFLKSSDEEPPPVPATSPDDDDFTTPAPTSRSTQNFTTVDLGSSQSLTVTASELGSSFFPSTTHWSEC